MKRVCKTNIIKPYISIYNYNVIARNIVYEKRLLILVAKSRPNQYTV